MDKLSHSLAKKQPESFPGYITPLKGTSALNSSNMMNLSTTGMQAPSQKHRLTARIRTLGFAQEQRSVPISAWSMLPFGPVTRSFAWVMQYQYAALTTALPPVTLMAATPKPSWERV